MASREQDPQILLDTLKGILEPHQVLKMILRQSVSQTGADRGIFVEVDPSGRLTARALLRFPQRFLLGESGKFSRGICEHALRTTSPVRLANAMTDARFMERDSIQSFRLVSVLCVPIEVEDRTVALVHLESNTPGHFDREHETDLKAYLGAAAHIMSAAFHDPDARGQAPADSGAGERTLDVAGDDWSFGRFIGRSMAVRELAAIVHKVARTEFPVLLIGETGTGKSILARVVHHASRRSARTFVTVFCPSLERGMVETELFGHKRGAFTGAVADRVGKVQAAEKGTLLLDEIGDLPLDIQPKLLRLLQEKTYERVGDPVEHAADVRVIAATNRDMQEEVRAGRFRRDLYERLNFVPIRIPPLRERQEDIPLLLRHFLDKYDAGRWIGLEEEANRFLVDLDFAWPGNARHLEHLAARLALERKREPLGRADLRRMLDAGASGVRGTGPIPTDLDQGLPAILAQTERAWLEEGLRRFPSLTRTELAAKLKISRAALYKKLRHYGLGA